MSPSYPQVMGRTIAFLPASCNPLKLKAASSRLRKAGLKRQNLKYIASQPIFLHTVDMVRLCLNVLALFAIIIAVGLMWQDFVSDQPSVLLGQIWFEIDPQSLQVSEAIIERYIDPCGLIIALGCSPFLWHPVIASVLQWPAVLFFALLAVIFNLIGRLFTRIKGRRRNYNRDSF